MIKCNRCNEEKELDQFYKRSEPNRGYDKECRSCKKQRSRNSFRKLRYDLTLDQYHQMVIDQDYKCFICGKQHTEELNECLLVDHCHKTGKIRGLLCQRCNKTIGMFEDNIEYLNNAIRYLETK